jgi:hypothetical protein
MTLALQGTLVPHDLDWGMVFILSLVGSEPEVVPMTDGVYVLEPDHAYTISAIMKNNAGPVIPVLAEARLVFADPSMPPPVVPYVNTAGLQTGATIGNAFAFTTPAATASTNGTITMSFVGNDDDAVLENDVVTLPVRIAP